MGTPSCIRQFWFAVVFSLFLMILSACGQDEKQTATAPPPLVDVVAVTTQEIGRYGEFVARTEAQETVNIQARVEGTLTERTFVEGDFVTKGDVLFRIEKAPFAATESKAKAELDNARAEYINAQKNWERGKALRRDDVISQADFDTMRTKMDQAKAAVSAAEAALRTAQIQTGYTVITAPISGRISKASHSVGNIVSPASGALATIYGVDPIYVTFTVNERLLIRHLQEARETGEQKVIFGLILSDGSDYSHNGTINYADTKVDETTGTLQLRAIFPNPDRLLLPGMFVTLRAESVEKENLPIIPQAAVQQDIQGHFVLVVDDTGTVKTRIVKLGRRIGPMWVVEEGLKAGEKIIVAGLQKVRPGGKVNAVLKTIDATTGELRDAEAQ